MNNIYLTPDNNRPKDNLKTIKEMFTNDKNIRSTTRPTLTWADSSDNRNHYKV